MRVIIAGAGKVGFSAAEILSAEGHDVCVIDSDPATVNILSNNLDVICVEGSATSSGVLKEAGAAEADLVFAATRSDETNMVCGITARRLGTKHVIARVRDEGYLSETEFLRDALGLSVIVNPEYECAMEISRILRFPSAIRVDAFSAGKLEIAEHRIAEDSVLAGVQLKDLGQRFNSKVLVGVVQRDGEAIIPKGDFTLAKGDLLNITGTPRELRKFFVSAKAYQRPIKNVMIMGGGRLGVYLARMLLESGMTVSVVENDAARCDELCELIPAARVIHGDATRSEVLLEEGLRTTDAFVALTGDDGDNIITSMYAKRCCGGKIVLKVNREYYGDILSGAGLDSVVTPRTLISQQLARYVRAMSNSEGSSMETLYRIAGGKVEALEFKVGPESACAGIPLKELKMKKNVLICSVVRGGKSFIPDGDTVIRPGDHAVVVTEAGWLKDLDAIIEVG